MNEIIVFSYGMLQKEGSEYHAICVNLLCHLCLSFVILYMKVWESDEEKHHPGAILHALGWPLDRQTYGGSFLYHMKDRQVRNINIFSSIIAV